jgi:tRNA nucleotidyltransferase (CCA-adding enzyme)
VLHKKSFTDDATRIWRAIRYEQRLDFRIEPDTLKLLRRDVVMLNTISGDRIRHELELALKEECPEKVLRRADELGVLSNLHSSLRGDDWLAGKYEWARKLSTPESPSAWLYLALLVFRLNGEEIEQLISYLNLPKTAAQTLRDTTGIKARIEALSAPGLKPSSIYSHLHGYSQAAIIANLIAANSKVAEKHISLYLHKLRYVRPALTGADLKRMGVSEGPRIKEIMSQLLEARLDGKVKNKRDEERLVEGWRENQ